MGRQEEALFDFLPGLMPRPLILYSPGLPLLAPLEIELHPATPAEVTKLLCPRYSFPPLNHVRVCGQLILKYWETASPYS